jgi:dynactin 1
MDPKKPEEKSKLLFKPGTRVSVKTAQQSGLLGTVRYYGTISGSTGSWVGVELESPLGKCNGTQNGVKYFECKNNYGLFVRSTQVKILEEEASIIKTAPQPKLKKIDDIKPELSIEEKAEENKTREEVKQKIAEKKQKIVDQIRKDYKEDIPKDDEPSPELVLVQKEETIKIYKQDLIKSNQEIELLKKSQASDSALISEMKAKINLLEQQVRSKGGNSDVQDLIETLTLEKEIAEENIESLQKELDETKQELLELKEEIELRNLELEQLQSEAVESQDYDSVDYKLALKKLYSESQNAKVEYENRIQQLENQLSDIPKLELKSKQVADLKSDLLKKEKEILNLKEALEEASQYSEMIENITEDNYNKTEKIKELEDRVKELQELHELEEQIAEDQAELERTLNLEIQDRDVTIQNLKNELIKMEIQKADYEKTINQFRVRVCELQNDVESLKDQLADTGEEEKMKKMQVLMEKNVVINNKMRDMMTMHINGKLNEVLYLSLLNKVTYMEMAIPDNVLESLDLGTLSNFLLVSSLRGKTYILISEVIRTTIDTVHDKYLIRWITNLSTLCINLIYDLTGIDSHLLTLSPKEYTDFMKIIDWGQILAINSNIDGFLKLLKEGGISSTISLENFNYSLGIIHQFSLQNISNVSGKALLSRGSLQISIGIYCLLQMYSLDDSIAGAIDYKDMLSKSLSLGKSVLDLTDENDLEPLKSFGEILSNRFTTVTKVLFDNEIIDYSSYNWVEWFIATDKDFKSIFNLNSIKKHEDKKILDPWCSQAKLVKDRLNKFEETTRELEETKNNLKTQNSKLAKVEKDLSELKIAKTSLESRLADAHAKSQRLAQLEIEKKRLQDREKYFEESLDAVNSEIERLQEKNKNLEEELTQYKEKEEDIKVQASINLASSETGGLFNMLRGSTITRHGAGPIGQDELETFSAIIDHYKIQKRHLSSEILKAQIREIPKFTNNESNPVKSKLENIYTAQSKLKKDISKLRVVDLNDRNSKEKVKKDKENLRNCTIDAKKTVEAIQNIISNDGNSASYIHTGPTGNLGKIVLGKGSNIIPVTISLEEFKGFKKILNLY